jgi:hypothetical protein
LDWPLTLSALKVNDDGAGVTGSGLLFELLPQVKNKKTAPNAQLFLNFLIPVLKKGCLPFEQDNLNQINCVLSS